MVQVVEQQGNIFGRLGKGLGQALSDQVPKEVDRYRLSQGLKKLGEKKDLTPFQQFAELSGIPGITPQMVQSGSELLKQQSMRNAYAKKAGRSEKQEGPSFQQGIKDIQNARMGNQLQTDQSDQNIPSRLAQKEQETINQPGQPQITDTNPLRPEAIPKAPWSPDRLYQEIDSLAQDFPNATTPELISMAKENEQRYLSQSEAERARDTYTDEIKGKVDNEFKKQLELKLQKQGEGVFKDITGENISRVKRLIEKDLKTNPNANVNDIVNTRTNQLLDLSKSKNIVNSLSQKPIYEKVLQGNEIRKGLESASKIYRETGNSQEYWNTLQSEFNLSPQGAASIAYPLNKKLKEYVSKKKDSKFSDREQNSRKYAIDIQDIITGNDSLLSIAHALRNSDPAFDETSFFDQLREDQDSLRLNSQQKDELIKGSSELFKNWGDILLLKLGN